MNIQKFPVDDRLPKATRAYAALREAIMTMRLAPGEALNERDICAVLEISRTPFREAVQKLTAEGLVRVVPSDATYVNSIVLQDVVEGHLVRETLEVRAMHLAALNFDEALTPEFELVLFQQASASSRSDTDAFFHLDNEFHRLICTAAGFTGVWATISGASGQLDRMRRRTLQQSGQLAEALEEHRAMLAALQARDTAGAVALIRRHLDDILRLTRAVILAEPDRVTGPEAFDRLEALIRAR